MPRSCRASFSPPNVRADDADDLLNNGLRGTVLSHVHVDLKAKFGSRRILHRGGTSRDVERDERFFNNPVMSVDRRVLYPPEIAPAVPTRCDDRRHKVRLVPGQTFGVSTNGEFIRTLGVVA